MGGRGCGLFRCRSKKIGDLAKITVEDDGRGIAPSKFALAMSRFGQLSPGFGSGLGLPIAKAVAEALGGNLDLVSKDPGLAVQISLPTSRMD